MQYNPIRTLFIILIAMTLMGGCSGPEAKKMKFFNKGKALYEKGDYVKAGLEDRKAALLVDPSLPSLSS